MHYITLTYKWYESKLVALQVECCAVYEKSFFYISLFCFEFFFNVCMFDIYESLEVLILEVTCINKNKSHTYDFTNIWLQ